MIKAVIFDMDGLLIDSEPLWWQAEIEVFGEVSIALDTTCCQKTTGFKVDEIVEYWYQRFPWSELTKKQVQERLVKRVIELIHQKGEPKKGVPYILRFLKEKDVSIVLASSSLYAIIDAVLDRLQLRDAFQVVYSAQEEQYGKPHPGVYLTTAQKMGVSPQRCLALEDSLNGVLAAKSASMKCIAIPEQFPSYNPKLIIADLILKSLADVQEDVWQVINAI